MKINLHLLQIFVSAVWFGCFKQSCTSLNDSDIMLPVAMLV